MTRCRALGVTGSFAAKGSLPKEGIIWLRVQDLRHVWFSVWGPGEEVLSVKIGVPGGGQDTGGPLPKHLCLTFTRFFHQLATDTT